MGYKNILVARYSPENKCFAQDGEWLIVGQPEHKMNGKLPEDHHFFVGIYSGNPSRYGWVRTLDYEITPEDLSEKHSKNPTSVLLESCRLLLKSASKYQEGTPMACTYSTIGILEKKKLQKVHKIIFYENKKQTRR